MKTTTMTTYSPAADPAETAPVGDCCEFCKDAATELENGDVRQADRKSKLDKGESVEEDEKGAARPHRDEEDKGVEGFRSHTDLSA